MCADNFRLRCAFLNVLHLTEHVARAIYIALSESLLDLPRVTEPVLRATYMIKIVTIVNGFPPLQHHTFPTHPSPTFSTNDSHPSSHPNHNPFFFLSPRPPFSTVNNYSRVTGCVITFPNTNILHSCIHARFPAVLRSHARCVFAITSMFSMSIIFYLT